MTMKPLFVDDNIAPGFEWVVDHYNCDRAWTDSMVGHPPAACTCPHGSMVIARAFDGVFVHVWEGEPHYRHAPGKTKSTAEGWWAYPLPKDAPYREAWERLKAKRTYFCHDCAECFEPVEDDIHEKCGSDKFVASYSTEELPAPDGLYVLVGPGVTRAGIGQANCTEVADMVTDDGEHLGPATEIKIPNPHNLERPELRRVEAITDMEQTGLELTYRLLMKHGDIPAIIAAPSQEALDAGRLDECGIVWREA